MRKSRDDVSISVAPIKTVRSRNRTNQVLYNLIIQTYNAF